MTRISAIANRTELRSRTTRETGLTFPASDPGPAIQLVFLVIDRTTMTLPVVAGPSLCIFTVLPGFPGWPLGLHCCAGTDPAPDC